MSLEEHNKICCVFEFRYGLSISEVITPLTLHRHPGYLFDVDMERVLLLKLRTRERLVFNKPSALHEPTIKDIVQGATRQPRETESGLLTRTYKANGALRKLALVCCQNNGCSRQFFTDLESPGFQPETIEYLSETNDAYEETVVPLPTNFLADRPLCCETDTIDDQTISVCCSLINSDAVLQLETEEQIQLTTIQRQWDSADTVVAVFYDRVSCRYGCTTLPRTKRSDLLGTSVHVKFYDDRIVLADITASKDAVRDNITWMPLDQILTICQARHPLLDRWDPRSVPEFEEAL